MIKKMMEITVAIKSVAGQVFAGQILLYVIVGTYFGLSDIAFSFIWQAVAIASITGILHYIAFTEAAIRDMAYPIRLTVFAAPLYIVLSAFAVFFRWFSFSIIAWLVFTLAFLVVFGAFIAAFGIYAKVTGKRYNESLSAYNRKST